MTDSIEELVRETLRERAAQRDRSATARVISVDYRARTRRRRRFVPVFGAVSLSGAVAAVIAVVTVGSSAAPAFAGWVPAPNRPAPGQIATALRDCPRGFNPPPGATNVLPNRLGRGTPVVVDTRGPYTAVVYSFRKGAGACLIGPTVYDSGAGENRTGEATPGRGQIQLFVTQGSDSSGNAFTVLDGHIGLDVRGVAIERSKGIAVKATVSHGWYLAWWPDSARAVAALITTTHGTSRAALPPDATQGPPSCRSGASGGCGAASFGSAGMAGH